MSLTLALVVILFVVVLMFSMYVLARILIFFHDFHRLILEIQHLVRGDAERLWQEEQGQRAIREEDDRRRQEAELRRLQEEAELRRDMRLWHVD